MLTRREAAERRLHSTVRAAARILLAVLTVIASTSALYATDRGLFFPRFSATTMNGETFTSGTLKGNVVLLQFWATWCPYCRADQPALDNIEQEFASQGLVVLAVNVGESRRTVRQYLDRSPRSCKLVLTEDTNLAAIFPRRGLPHYVLIDRDGKVVAERSGAGGEGSLRRLLNGAFRNSDPMNVNARRTATADAAPASPAEPDSERPLIVRREPSVERAPAVQPAPPPDPLITVKGTINRLDCLGEVARLHIVAGRETHLFLVRQPDQVVTPGAKTKELRCGQQRTAVSVQFLPGNDDKYGTVGEVRAIDFVDWK